MRQSCLMESVDNDLKDSNFESAEHKLTQSKENSLFILVKPPVYKWLSFFSSEKKKTKAEIKIESKLEQVKSFQLD